MTLEKVCAAGIKGAATAPSCILLLVVTFFFFFSFFLELYNTARLGVLFCCLYTANRKVPRRLHGQR
jgi:hypothetical protein